MHQRWSGQRKHPVSFEGVPGNIGPQPLNAILKDLCTPSNGTAAWGVETTMLVSQPDRRNRNFEIRATTIWLQQACHFVGSTGGSDELFLSRLMAMTVDDAGRAN